MKYQAIAQNTKVYFGDKIPSMFMDPLISSTASTVKETNTDTKEKKVGGSTEILHCSSQLKVQGQSSPDQLFNKSKMGLIMDYAFQV